MVCVGMCVCGMLCRGEKFVIRLVVHERTNVFYGHAALRRDVAHHGNHRNIKCIFDYLDTLYW